MSTTTQPQEWDSIIKRVPKPSYKPETMIEIAILGNPDVGKTSLSKKYKDPNYDLSQYEKIKTIGIDTTTSYISICDNMVTKFKQWDTAGQESHANIVGAYVRKLDACLMVLNLCDPNGLQSIFKWYDQLQKVK